MAIVNVDLSEYDAICKRNPELEEQVKELKRLNDFLGAGRKGDSSQGSCCRT